MSVAHELRRVIGDESVIRLINSDGTRRPPPPCPRPPRPPTLDQVGLLRPPSLTLSSVCSFFNLHLPHLREVVEIHEDGEALSGRLTICCSV